MYKIRALIVDDSSVMRKIVERSLRQSGSGLAKRSHQENWLPILELAIQEVFEIMLGCQVKPMAPSEHKANAEFTAMVGLAGALCGIMTVCCDANTARQIATCMLRDETSSEEHAADALGDI